MYFVILQHTQTSHRVLYAGRASTALVAAIAATSFRVNERTSVRDAHTINRIRCAYLKHTDELGDEYFALNQAHDKAKEGASISLNFGPASEPATVHPTGA